MKRDLITRRSMVLGLTSAAGIGWMAGNALAQQPREGLVEPVYRVAGADAGGGQGHPLDPAIEMAIEGLEEIRSTVTDYTATLVKRELINGRLHDREYISLKVRHEQRDGDRIVVPFSAYLYFLAPANIRGREVIWIRGQNDNKMVAHESNRLLPTVWLRPDSRLAMRDNRYPITDIGIEMLILRLIERAHEERQHGECEVEFFEGAEINGRVCTCLQVTHPQPRPHFQFHIARVFIDDELKVPIRFESYLWPETPGGRPPVLEEYTYLNLQLNPGLDDLDFDPENPAYNFE